MDDINLNQYIDLDTNNILDDAPYEVKEFYYRAEMHAASVIVDLQKEYCLDRKTIEIKLSSILNIASNYALKAGKQAEYNALQTLQESAQKLEQKYKELHGKLDNTEGEKWN